MNCRKWEVVGNRISKEIGLAVIKNYWIGIVSFYVIAVILPNAPTFEPPQSEDVKFFFYHDLIAPIVVALVYLNSRYNIINSEKYRENFLKKLGIEPITPTHK